MSGVSDRYCCRLLGSGEHFTERQIPGAPAVNRSALTIRLANWKEAGKCTLTVSFISRGHGCAQDIDIHRLRLGSRFMSLLGTQRNQDLESLNNVSRVTPSK